MISLVGIDPGARRRYQWLGDPACDREHSDLEAWIARGEGLVAHEGQRLTTIVCAPLRPTTLEIVWRHGLMGASRLAQPVAADGLMDRNLPAVYRAAVAYSVVDIEDGPVCQRIEDAGGPRLADSVLDLLDRCMVRITRDSHEVRVRLVDHLGTLVLGDAVATDAEGKA